MKREYTTQKKFSEAIFFYEISITKSRGFLIETKIDKHSDFEGIKSLNCELNPVGDEIFGGFLEIGGGLRL